MISLLHTGRCGSSMIAGIFAAHGVFTGKCRPGNELNQKGFFENIKVKKELKQRFGFDLLGPIPEKQSGWMDRVYEIFKEDGYTDGPCLVKIGAFYANVWDAKHIKVRRNLDSILKSYKRSGFLGKYSDAEVLSIVERQIEIMDKIDCPEVWTEDVVHGDYSGLEAAFEYVGVPFNPLLADEFVDLRLYEEDS